jgi:hypothetical protein
MHWTAGFRHVSISGIGGPPPVMCIVSSEQNYIFMHRNLFVTTAFLICVWSQPCCAGTTNTFEIGRAWEKIVGVGYKNGYSVPSKAEAVAKLKSFRDLGREVTLQEFLGGEIGLIRISYYYKPLDFPDQTNSLAKGEHSLDEAGALVKELLASVIVDPKHGDEPALWGPAWSEWSSETIRALVLYRDSRIGRIQCDATEDSLRDGGVHLFFEDHDGTYWWHRWDTAFPRKVRETPANKDGAASGSQPIRSETNSTPSAAGSRR